MWKEIAMTTELSEIIKCPFRNGLKKCLARYSIQTKIKILHLLMVMFICGLASVYSGQIRSLKNQLENMSKVNNMLQNMLEVRRYEKDIMLHVGTDNLYHLKFHLEKVKDEFRDIKKEISTLADSNDLEEFETSMKEYEILLDRFEKDGVFDHAGLRTYGRKMVNFCHMILEKKNHSMHTHLELIFYWFTIVPGILIILVGLLIHFQTSNVLNRLAVLQKATTDLLQDKFVPIEDDPEVNDEVSHLIKAFNTMARELEIKQEEVLQSKKLASIGTFSSGIAHELNNPLNNISLSTDTLMEEYDEMEPEEVKEILDDIMVQTERASKIVRNLLEFSREKAPSISLLTMKDVIDSTAELIENELRIKGVHLETCVGTKLPPILGDKNKLQQVFLNLFINAIQAMPDGGLIHLDTRVEPAGYIRVDVSDTGKGIPQNKIDKIFDPFFTTKAVGEGTGLGLSIVYSIIKKHGGHLEVKSKPGVGTTFSIFLPIAKNGVEECKKEG